MSAGFFPTGGRYVEDGPAVPGNYLVSARDRKLTTILKNELDKKSRETNANEFLCHRNHNKKTNLYIRPTF